jgi:hypothetical protein
VDGRRVASRGFETRVPVSGPGPFVVRALDARGHVLGKVTAS